MNETAITALSGTPFIDMTREFDATPAQVFRVWTDPELVPQWLARAAWTRRYSSTTCRQAGVIGTCTV